MKLISYRMGTDPVAAEGDPDDPGDRAGLSEAFDRLIADGMWATVATSQLDACCKRGLMFRRFSNVPRNAEKVLFFPRNVPDDVA